ncbi:tyrosine-protein phosphatase [Ponticaulis sp.]|uniref:tyrosine-protein phosphatase n=1 Tax=Ponticaulis sp. TaxID=2020902 RepID=UPI000B6C2F91|nr:tyrosine-protein phosphatase [Ponticaulis sp.]MAI91109.1 hypothetical protein [Ponticaulis sp.]OUX98430.1 MAG: hypothetical protein CBB65_11730 [Hyphomonadaceae bacterium TMED5]|tara:strand:- start:28100 stop:28876 length:777 start_codon:yes stop_codon:yes gene_type:complete
MQDRVKPLSGVRNFRDFGGYDTPTGRIRQGLLFRSGHYNDATDEDIVFLNDLGVTFHVDLRRPDERDRQPNKWPAESVVMIASEGGRQETPAHVAALQGDNVTADSIEGYMTNYYREAPFKEHHVELFRAWFDGLEAAQGASVVHCAAGKDRTGIICALTHLALGVGEEDVFIDYDLTNTAVDIEAHLPLARDRFNKMLGQNHEADVYRPFMGVRNTYLENAFEAMSAEHGSPMSYAENVLGLTSERRDILKKKYVES